MRRRAAGEVVALDHALESLAAPFTDHVDALAVGEDRAQHLVAGLQATSSPAPAATFTSRRTRVGGTLAFL